MNLPLLTELVSLRYRLLWASIRSRNGRILLAVIAMLFFGLFAALALAGGLAGALASVRSGQAERITQGMLSVLFLQAILVANLAGFGMNALFSEAELRRYPLTALDRMAARHLIAMLDPFWFLYLIFYASLGAGLVIFGGGGMFSAPLGALLLLMCTYAAARVVDLAAERLTARKGLTEIVIGLAAVGAIALAVIMHGTRVEQFYPWLSYSPSFAAAGTMTRGGFLGPFTVLVGWLVALIGLLIGMERNPVAQSRSQPGVVVWDTLFDRVGERFGSRLGPLVAFWLRFNFRNTISRRLRWIALPIFGFLSFAISRAEHRANPQGIFLVALGALPMAAFIASGRIVTNQFGFMGGGLRRLLLMPVPASLLVWSCCCTSTMLSFGMAALCLVGWVVAAPLPFDARMIAMLACTGVSGVLFLQAVAVWTSVYNPSRGNYFMKIGNDLSVGANALFALSAVGCILGPGPVSLVWPAATSPETWWVLVPFPFLAAALYVASVIVGGWAFARRREKVLAVVEGK